MTDDPATRLLQQLATFAKGLGDEERELLAALLAPGIARAWGDDEDVSGFGSVTWLPESLPEHLAAAVRDRRLRIEGL